MGLFSILDTSIFKESTYKNAIDGKGAPYNITITDSTDDKLSILGVLKGGINFNMDATWSDLSLGNIVNNFKMLQSIGNIISFPLAVEGVSYDNAGFMTEKFFSKGGYLEIEPTFEVVNWNGDGMPLKAAAFLLNYCVPQKTSEYTVGDVMKELVPFKDQLKKIKDKLGIGDSQGFIEGGLSSIGDGIMGATDTVFGNGGMISQGVDDARAGGGKMMQKNLFKTKSPTSVNVAISNYFELSDMIIEAISIEFSDKITETGPMKAEFKVRLSTKTMPTTSDMGLKVSGKRVSEIFSGQLNTSGL